MDRKQVIAWTEVLLLQVNQKLSCWFVDTNCRVYQDWEGFLENNCLPKCTYCYPVGGIYNGDENDNVMVEFGQTPASSITNQICNVLDTASTVVTVRAVDFMLRLPYCSFLTNSTASPCSKHTYSNHSWGCLLEPGMKRRGEGILRMEDAGTSEEDNDSQDSNTSIDHGHLAQNCLIKITMLAVKASVIYKCNGMQ